MAISIDDIAPKDPAAPAPTSDTPTIPDEVLQIPAFSALLRGAPPAVYAPATERALPEVQAIERNIEPLMEAGFGIYKPLDGSGSVLFNTQFVDEAQLKVADQKGKLNEFAPPISELLGFFNSEIPAEGAAPAAAPVAAPTAAPVSAPAPAPSAQRAVAQKRATNLQTGGPTSGPTPGQGRVLNSILKPVI
jgi:hypothetical protein